MSEKHLTELPWKTLVVKQGLKDLGLQKALVAYAKLEATKEPQKALEALNEISELALKLKKTYAAKEEVVDYLGEMVKEVKKTTPALAAKVEEAAAAAKQEEDEAVVKMPTDKPGAKDKDKDKDGGEEGEEDEEEHEEAEAAEFKKDIKKQMVSALAQVKQRAPGDPEQAKEPKPQLKFMAYLAAKSSAVVVARKVGAATKKLLPDIAGGASGGKFVQGDCIFEENAHTFVLEQVPGGLAKKLATALNAETGQKYKVRVRNTDGSLTLDSDTDVDPDATAGGTAAKTPSLVALQQTRLAWDKTRKTIQAELKKLEESILTACQGDEEVGVDGLNIGILLTILQRLDTRLIDKLDEALNAEDPTQRAQLNQQAKAIVNEYLAFVNENPLMAEIDDSGFVPVVVRKTALGTLTLLSSKL